MRNQTGDITALKRVIGHCQRREWLVPGLMASFRSAMRGHTIVPRDAYFAAVMKELGKTPSTPLHDYVTELTADTNLEKAYRDAVAAKKMQPKYNVYSDKFKNAEANVVHYYALIRETQPDIVVETGTASGSWTSVITSALEKNGKGTLISIDLPATKGKLTMDTSIDAGDAGFLIPKEYRHRWTLKTGDAKLLLPTVLAEHSADIFIHDSLHTRTHMLFEYNVARALMKPGSVILSDDILWNNAFFSFVESHHLRSFGCISNPNLGFVVNRFDEYESAVGTGIVQ